MRRPPLGPLLLALSLLLLQFGAEWAGDRSTCVLALQWNRGASFPPGLVEHGGVLLPLQRALPDCDADATFANATHLLLLFGGDTSASGSAASGSAATSGANDRLFVMPWPLDIVATRASSQPQSRSSKSSAGPDPFPAQLWVQPVPPVSPAARFQLVATSAGTRYPHIMLIFGGSDLLRTFSSLWAFNIQSSRWIGVGPAPSSAQVHLPNAPYYADVDAHYWNNFALAQVDGAGCPWPGARALSTLLTVGSSAVLLFGLSNDAAMQPLVLGDVWQLDLGGDDLQAAMDLQGSSSDGVRGQYVWPANRTQCTLPWRQLTHSAASSNLTTADASSSFPPNRYAMGAAVLDGAIWIIGGVNPPSQWGDLWILHLEPQPRWQQIFAAEVRGTAGLGLGLQLANPAARFQAGFMALQSPFPAAAAADGASIVFLMTGGQPLNTAVAPTPDMWLLLCNTSVSSASAGSASASSSGSPLDIGTCAWQSYAPAGMSSYAPNSRGALSLAVPGTNQLLQHGGIPYAGDPNAVLWLVDADPAANLVRQVDPTPAPMFGSGALPAGKLFPSTRWQAYVHAFPGSNSVWLYGGTNASSKALTDLWEYRMLEDAWLPHGSLTEAAAAPTPTPWPTLRLICTWLGYDNTLFLLFGRTARLNADEIWAYDTRTQLWRNQTTNVSSLTHWPPAPVRSDSVTALDSVTAFDVGGVERGGFLYPADRTYAKGDSWGASKFVVFGGLVYSQSTRERANDLWVGEWTHGGGHIVWECVSFANYSRVDTFEAEGPAGRIDSVLNVWGDDVWLAFGLSARSNILTDVWRFNLFDRRWSSFHTPMTAVYAAASVMVEGRWYLYGGADNRPSSSLWEMDVSSLTWRSLTPLTERAGHVAGLQPGARCFANAALLRPDSRTYVMAMFGGEAEGFLDDLELLFIDAIALASKNATGALQHDLLSLLPFSPSAFEQGRQPNQTAHAQFATLAGAIAYHQGHGAGFVRYLIEPPAVAPPPPQQTKCTGRRRARLRASAATSDTASHRGSRAAANSHSLTDGISLINITAACSIESAHPSELAVLDCNDGSCLSIATALHAVPVTLSRLLITNGWTDASGGCVRAVQSSVHLSAVQLHNCGALVAGGGMSALQSVVLVADSLVHSCVAGSLGGGAAFTLSTVNVTSSTFVFNSAVGSDPDAEANEEYSGGGGRMEKGTALRNGTWHGFGRRRCSLLLYACVASLSNSTLSSNFAPDGGAISCLAPVAYVPSVSFLTNQPVQLTIDNCTFTRNEALFRGSAVFLSNLDDEKRPSSVTASSFFDNFVANHFDSAGSGTVYAQATALSVSSSLFARNRALSGGGGATFWEPGARDTQLQQFPRFSNMSDQTDNQAAFGAFRASSTISLLLLLDDESRARQQVQVSGQAITPPLLVALLDFYGNVVSTDNSTFISVMPTDSLAGSVTVQVVNGVANFSALRLLLHPQQSVTFTFTASIPLLRSGSDLAGGPLSVTLVSAPCTPGQFDTGLQCEDCAAGRFSNSTEAGSCSACGPGSTQPHSRATTCQACAVGTASAFTGLSSAECPACPFGSTAWAAGRSSCVQCDVGTRCDEGSAVAQTGYWLVPFDPIKSGDGDAWPRGLNCSGVENSTVAQLQQCSAVVRHSIPCPFHNCDGTGGSCAANRINPPELNPLCGSCTPPFTEVSHQCVQCTHAQPLPLVGLLLLAFLFVLVMHALASARSSADLAVFFYFTQATGLVIGDVKGYLSWTHLLRGSIHETLGATCVVPMGAQTKLALQLLTPVALLTMLAILAAIQLVLRREAFVRCLSASRCGRWLCFKRKRANTDDAANLRDDADAAGGRARRAAHRDRLSAALRSPDDNQLDASLLDDADQDPRFPPTPALTQFAPSSGAPAAGSSSSNLLRIHDSGLDIASPSDQGQSPSTSPLDSSSPAAASSPTAMTWRLGWSRESYLRTCISLLLFSFQSVTDSTLAHLDCVDAGRSRVVFLDPTIDCESSAYRRGWLVVLSLFAAGWVFGLPMVVFGLLYRNRVKIGQMRSEQTAGAAATQALRPVDVDKDHHLASVSVAAPVADVATVQFDSLSLSMCAMISSPYRSSCFYWQVVILARRVLLSAVVTVFSNNAGGRLCALSLVHGALLLLHLHARPFASQWINHTESLSLAALLAMSVLLQWQVAALAGNSSGSGALQAQPDSAAFALPLVVVVSLLACGPVVVMAAHWLRHKYLLVKDAWMALQLRRRSQRKQRHSEMLPLEQSITVDKRFD